jgi:threonine dehydrogenase-like Zn-dependent dehydrogenase
MRGAVVCDGSPRIQRLPRPEPAPGEALVRLRACGICGTDLHFHQMGFWPDGHRPGHEMFGEVEALGDGASGVSVGDPVAIEPISACGRCEPCRAGRGNICPQAKLFGIHLPGGFAEAIALPAERLFRVPRDLSPELAALAEPTAVAIHGLRRGGLSTDQRVLVLGAGTIGLLCVAAARAAGAGEVWLSARHEHQREIGAALGAERVLSEAEATPLALAGAGGEAPIDLVVETVGGAADTLHAAAAAVRPGGAISVLGVFMGDVPVPAFPMLVKEGTLTWSNCYERTGGGADFADAVALLSAERSALAAVTTHSLPLAEVERAFAIAHDKRAGAVKVTLRCD